MTAPVPPEAVEAVSRASREHQRQGRVSCTCGGWWSEAHVDEHIAAAVVAALHLPDRDREVAAKALDDAADADDWDSALGRANVRVRLRARATALREGREP